MSVRKTFLAVILAISAGIACADNYQIPAGDVNSSVKVTDDPTAREAAIRSTIGAAPSVGRHTITYTDGSSESFDVTFAAFSGVEFEIAPNTQRDAYGNPIGSGNGGGDGSGDGSNPGYGGNNGGWGGGYWVQCGTASIGGSSSHSCVST